MNRMKFWGVLFSLAMFSFAVSTQQKASNSDSYQLGSRLVRIPWPDDFINVVPRFDKVSTRFIVTEYPYNEMLAVHVPKSYVPGLEKGESPTFTFYTKVSVLKSLKASDITQADFRNVVETYEKNSPTLLDINGPVLKLSIESANKGLTELTGKDPGMELGQPKNLGYFDKQDNVYSSMVLINVKDASRSNKMLVGASVVMVNSRLIYVYSFRIMESEKDVEILRDFTKKWTAAIVAANK